MAATGRDTIAVAFRPAIETFDRAIASSRTDAAATAFGDDELGANGPNPAFFPFDESCGASTGTWTPILRASAICAASLMSSASRVAIGRSSRGSGRVSTPSV
jgi:hypothetical protein